MAEGKNSVVIYRDWKDIFEKLTDEEAGKLIKHLFRYVNDEEPKSDRLIELIFEPIKQTLKRDLKHWEQVKVKRAEAGKKGGENSGRSRKQNEANEANASNKQANEANGKQNEANEAVSDSVSVSVSDSVNVINTFISADENMNEINKSVLRYFGIDDNPINHNNHALVWSMICTLKSNEMLHSFHVKFEHYKRYKQAAKEKIHGLKSFCGDADMRFLNGGWCEQNWEKKLADLSIIEQKPKDGYIPVSSYGPDFDHKSQKF